MYCIFKLKTLLHWSDRALSINFVSAGVLFSFVFVAAFEAPSMRSIGLQKCCDLDHSIANTMCHSRWFWKCSIIFFKLYSYNFLWGVISTNFFRKGKSAFFHLLWVITSVSKSSTTHLVHYYVYTNTEMYLAWESLYPSAETHLA